MRHVELFAGIGGFRHALSVLSDDFNLEQTTVAFSEIDESAYKSYTSVYDTSGEIEIGDIVSFCKNAEAIRNLPDFELLTGGFPCQAFSMMGKQKGFEDMRGNVFFQILDILKVKKPRYVLLENVRNLVSHDKGATFNYIVNSLHECGYKNVYFDIFNSANFGLAQTRNRVFIFATTEDINEINFSQKQIRKIFNEIESETSLLKQKSTHQILKKTVDKKYYLSEVIKPTILSSGTKNYKSKAEINKIIARPLTATMVKMHRACQDNYFSDGYIQSDDPLDYLATEYSFEELCTQKIRRLTPHEAFTLQGFSHVFYENVKKSNNSDTQLYRQAGNAVSVNTVYAILYYLFVHLRLGR